MKSLALRAGQAPAKNSKKKWIFLSAGIAAAGVLSWFGWQYLKTRKEETDEVQQDLPNFTNYSSTSTHTTSTGTSTSNTSKPKTSTSTSSSTSTGGFPLKRGSKGEKVKQVQQVLIAKLGKDALGTAGADGDFGPKTEAALKKAGLPTVIDESTFNVLVKTASIDPGITAKKLWEAAQNKNYASAIAILKDIKSTTDYAAVSEAFKKYKINGVSQTLVNGMLNTFTNEAQKEEIRLAFLSMGLKYDGDKWALSGIGDLLLITKQPTKVWVDPRTYVNVPVKMVLGKFIESKANFSLFENDNRYFLVEAQHVSSFHA